MGKNMTKQDVLNRVTLKGVKNEVKQVAKVIDLNAPANPRLTYALYQANRAASKIDGCKVFNDWHKQGLTVKEVNDLIAQYNKITGYVYKPKEVKKGKVTVIPNENSGIKNRAEKMAVIEAHKATQPNRNPKLNVSKVVSKQVSPLKEAMRAKLDAIADLRKEGYSNEDIQLLLASDK